MISSEQINYSKYSKINESNSSLSSKDGEINRRNNSNIEKENTNTNSLIISEENENENEGELLVSEESQNTSDKNDLLYGNKIEIMNPTFIGKCIALFYNKNGYPNITIGPDCKSYRY